MKIITISREFGSGGRELGKRLADLLHFDYYDREIISAIAENQGLDPDYVEKTLENRMFLGYSLNFRHSFSSPVFFQQSMPTKLLIEQTKIIKGIAQTGRDCVIVGRNADVLLKEEHPLNIFVHAEDAAKLRRCQERAPEGEHLTPREMAQMIRRIDNNRARTRELVTDSRWGQREAYHLMVNTTGWDIKELTPAVASFAEHWFGRTT